MDNRPRIRIVNTDGVGHSTQVLTEDGVDIANAITEIDLHLKVGEINTAKIQAILIGANIDAEVIELQTKVIPPPLPKTTYKLSITQKRLGYPVLLLERHVPLPTYGEKIETLVEADVVFPNGAPPLPIFLTCEESE